ncbi:hypothetical protein [Bdellovibrio sp. HCB209]|uniref:hypothetical protein n=1 Tax=Bdellovibrio sp. HCB209 TaxID=3394354 RepID=UPI0039B58CEC
MKLRILMAAFLLANTAQASSVYRKYATCKVDDITITTYSAGINIGQLIWNKGDSDVLHKDVVEKDEGTKRTFSAGHISVAIDSADSKGTLSKDQQTYPLTCTIAKNPAPVQISEKLKIPDIRKKANCFALPPGIDVWDPKLCPPGKLWGAGGDGGFFCCKHPPT